MRKSLAISAGALCLASVLAQAAPLRVGVSVLPLESIVSAIGGNRIEVQSLQREGDSCSVFEPRPSVISWLAGADLFFRTGVSYESVVLGKLASQFPRLRVHDLREPVALRTYSGHDLRVHSHAGHAHDHADCAGCAGHAAEASDPHIWLDPHNLMQMADWIAARLGEALPEARGEFVQRAEAFKARARAVDQRLAGLLQEHAGKGFYIYHPALNYFAARYGLRQLAIAGPNQPPTARELQRLMIQARSEGVRTIFVQPQESRRHAELLAAPIAARVVEIDPMAADWEAGLLAIGEALALAMREVP